jgi:hypothetical protein
VAIQKKRHRSIREPVKMVLKKGRVFDIQFIRKDDPQWKKLKALAEQTKENTLRAIRELKEELHRMRGGVVDADHLEKIPSEESLAWRRYSLNPEHFDVNIPSDSDSDTCPSDEEDENGD